METFLHMTTNDQVNNMYNLWCFVHTSYLSFFVRQRILRPLKIQRKLILLWESLVVMIVGWHFWCFCLSYSFNQDGVLGVLVGVLDALAGVILIGMAHLLFWLPYLVLWLAYLVLWLAYLVFWLVYLVFPLVYLVFWLAYLVFFGGCI